jgi:hypothetical protein
LIHHSALPRAGANPLHHGQHIQMHPRPVVPCRGSAAATDERTVRCYKKTLFTMSKNPSGIAPAKACRQPSCQPVS